MKIILAFIVILLLNLTFTSAQKPTPVKLQLKWKHQFQAAGFYAAQQKGFYKEAGLNVTIKEGDGSIDPISEVLSDNVQFGVFDGEIISRFLNGDDVKLVAPILQHSPYVLLSLKQKNISTPFDLLDKRIYVFEQHGLTQFFGLIREEGLPLYRLNFIDTLGTVYDLIAGRADVLLAYATFEPGMLKQLGYESNIISARDYGVDFYGDVLFTSGDYATNNPEIVQKFKNASLKGWEYALKNKSEIIDYILTLPTVQKRGITRNELEYESILLDEYIDASVVELGHNNVNRWKRMANYYNVEGETNFEDRLSNFFFSYSPATVGISKNLSWIIILLVVFVTALLALLTFFIFRKQFHRYRQEIDKEAAEKSKTQELLQDREFQLTQRLQLIEFFNASSQKIIETELSALRIRLETILEYACVSIDADRAYIYEFSESANTNGNLLAFYRANSSVPNYYETQPVFELKKYQIIKNQMSQNSINISISSDDNAFLPKELKEGYEQSGVKLLYNRILTIGGHVYGVLGFANSENLFYRDFAALEVINLTGQLLKSALQRIRYEKELLDKSAKAMEADKLKSALLANLSHELRTPLNGILGLSQFLEEELQESYFRDTAKRIHQSGRRLLNTLSAIIELAELYANPSLIELEEVDMIQLLSTIVESHRSSAEFKGLQLTFHYPEKSVITFSSSKMLREIFENLINNAVKFTESGMVTISMKILSDKNKDYIAVDIIDTGIGIRKEAQEVIFEEFRQESEGMSRRFEGTGLGLTLSKKMIEQLNGRILLESTEGAGSKFTVLLPISTAIQANKTSEKSSEPVLAGSRLSKNKRILVVEDNDVNLELFKMFLKDVHSATYARNGIDALKAVDFENFDLILMDINLGVGINGIDVAKEILTKFGDAAPPMIAVTGYAMGGDKKTLLSLGFTAYISKPFGRETLLSEIDNLYRTHS